MAAPAERALPEKASAKGAFAHELFFPGAFALALIAVPVWLLAHLGLLDRPELTSPAWHAHEMLFGYTLAVVAGFLLARLSRPWLALLFGAWLAGRAAMLLGLDGPIAVMLALLFPLLLAAQTAPAFLRAARKGTNQAFAPILIGFIAAALLVQAGDLGLLAEGRRHGLLLALDLVTLLLLMGGRIIPAATAGVFYRRSEELKARVQPVLERTVLAAAGADAGARPGAGGGLGRRCRGAGRRRGNRPAARPLADPRACRPSRSVGLHLGYAWLALALILKGAALLATSPHLVGLHHALAIGALGTMTLVMMLRTAASRGQRTRAVPGAVGLVALALSLATLARLAAPLLHGVAHVLGLGLAAGLWAIGVLICAALYLAVRAPRARETPPAHSFFHRAANPATMAPARSEAGGAMRETFHSPSTAAPPTATRLPRGIAAADLDLIRSTPLLGGLDQRALAELLEHAAVRRFENNAILFLQDEPATSFYVVLDGWVRLYRETAEGQESTIAILTRGESFAEAVLFLGGSYPVTGAVVDHARLLMIRGQPFLRQLRANPDLALNMLASMSVHLRRLVRQVEQLTVRSSTERLADFLLRLAPTHEASAIIELPWDKALVATRLGMRPETLSRSLAKLRDLGVEAHGARITIREIETLRQYLARQN